MRFYGELERTISKLSPNNPSLSLPVSHVTFSYIFFSMGLIIFILAEPRTRYNNRVEIENTALDSLI